MCAQEPDAPNPPTALIASLDQIAIEWNPPASDGGSPVLGYQVQMKETSESGYTLIYDGSENPNARILEITQYNSAALQVTTYNIRVLAVNWVGPSSESTSLDVILATQMSPTDSVVSGTGIGTIEAFVDAQVNVLAKDSTPADLGTGGDILSLEVANHCQVTNNFECVEVNPDTNILDNTLITTMTDNGDGTYSATYNVPIDGTVTVSVFLMQVGGAYVEYFENLYMDGTPAASGIDPRIDHDWGTGLITSSATDFVSARWYTKVRAPTTEDISFTIEADDGVRLYFEGELKFDRWDECCEDQTFTVLLTQDNYYDIKIDYKEEQGSAKIKLYWSSLSLPKEIIPTNYLYYPRYVGSSPYQVTVNPGPSIPSKSTASGDGLSQATVGMLAVIDIVSRDFVSTPLDNQNDNYELFLSNTDGTGNGNMYFTSTYVGATGRYQASYIPIQSGTFTIEIKLRGQSIQDSPFSLTVSPLDTPSAEHSTTDISTPISISAGSTYSFVLTGKDIFGTTITTGGKSDTISIKAYFQNATSYDSQIGVADLTNWQQVLGYDISGSVEDMGDGTYTGQVTILKAALFELRILINDISLTSSPFSPFDVVPSEIYAPQSVASGQPSSVTSGTASTFNIQGRDYYANNANALIATASTTSVELRSAVDNSLVVSGTITDHATHAGVYVVSFTPTTSGQFMLYVSIEGLQIQDSPFSITVEPASTTDLTQTTLTTFANNYTTGEYIEFMIEARDLNGNIRTSSTSEVFTVTLTDSGSTASSVTPVSNNNGTYNVSYQFTKSSVYTLEVKDSAGTNHVASSPYANIEVVANDVVALKSNFISAANPINSGAQTTYQIQGKDVYSNNIVNDESYHQFFISLLDSQGNITVVNNLTYQFGVYETDITLYEAGSYDMIIGLIRNGGLRATYYKTVSFYDHIQTLQTYYHTSLEPTHYTQIDQTVNIDAGNLAVLTGMPSQFFSIEWEGYLLAPHSGKFRFYVESEDYHFINLTLDGSLLISLNDSSAGVIPSSGDYYADYTLTEGSLYSLTLQYAERIGSSEVKFYWESDQLNKEIIPKTYLYNTLYSENTPITLVVQPLDTSETNVIVNGDYSQAVSGVQETISIEARDMYGNLQIHQTDVFTVTLTNTADSSTVNGVVTVTANGLYQSTYTLSTAGTYEMAILVQPNGSGSSLAVTGSPFAVVCIDSTTDPSQTQMSGDALTTAIAGQIMNFTVTLKDAQGNVRTSGGDTVVATLKDSTPASVGSTWVTDNDNGTYTVEYMHTVKGAYTIEVVVNSDTGNTKTSNINMVAGAASGSQSTLTHAGSITIGQSVTFTSVAKDEFGNTITHESKDIAYQIIGNHDLVSGTIAVNDLANAQYQASYTIPTPSGNDVSTCGTIGIYAYFVEQGLEAKYYSNRWFAGTPVMTKIDTQVNFDFESNEIIQSVASDYVSIEWNGYLKPTYSEDFTFVTRSNDGIRVTLGGVVIIDALNQTVNDGDSFVKTSNAISLVANQFIPIKIEYYEITGEAFVVLEWSSSSQASQVIPSTQFYYAGSSATPITGSSVSSSSVYNPMKVTNVSQGDSTTYKNGNITVVWVAPTDYGCSVITGYDIQVDDGSTVQTHSFGDVSSAEIDSLTSGTSYTVTVTAKNVVNSGIASDSVVLIPSALPGVPGAITVTTYAKNSLTLQWSAPADTGAGDASTISIVNYKLEADEGFGDGFVTLVEQSSVTYVHTGLISGHVVKYRVTASNFLGYGTTSSEYTFSAADVPSKPTSPPSNVPASTTQSVIYISYDEVEEDGGSPVLNYNIYIDDGNDGAFGSAIDNGNSLTYNTASLSLTTGLTYRFKYAANNTHGEGELSDEVAILLAELPGAPATLIRVDKTILSAGVIRFNWTSPSSNGGDTIQGFYVYLDGNLIYQASNTENSYTIYDLIVGTSHVITVSAYNSVGEGATASLTEVAASVPAKMSRPTRSTSNTTSITVQWTTPSFDGGAAVTGYEVRRDAGPGTAFETEIAESTTSKEFSTLSNTLLTYRIQVRAINSIGKGEWSEATEFYATATPGAPTSLTVDYQSTSMITLSWQAPSSNGGCDIAGYRLYMEDTTQAGFGLIYDGSKNSAMLTYSVTAPTITAARTYNFRVEAIACGLASSNATISAKAGSKPDKLAQAPIVQSYIASSSAKISFTPPANDGGYEITSFKVYIAGTLNQTLTPIGPHEFTLTGLTEGTYYKVQVSSVNAVTESEHSDALTFLFANVPSVPQTLALTSTETTISATWSAPASNNGDTVTGYNIYINDGQGSEPVLVTNTIGSPSILSYSTMMGGDGSYLECGRRYYLEITAVNVAGESAVASSSVIVGQTPNKPQNVRVTGSVPNDKLTIQWDAPDYSGCIPITNYTISIDGTDQNTSITADDTSLDIDISADGAYGKQLTIAMKASNAKTASDYTSDLVATVGSAPNAPSNPQVVSRPSQTSLELSWTADTAIASNVATTDYRVYRLNTDSTYILLFTTEDSSLATSALLTNLETVETYTLVVRAVNIYGESIDSDQEIVIIGQKPTTPSIPILTTQSSSDLGLQIVPSSSNGGVPITKYTVYYDIGQTGTFTKTDITDLADLTWSQSSLTSGTLVDIKVSATNSINESDNSTMITYLVAGVPGAPTSLTNSTVPVEQEDGSIAVSLSWAAPSAQGSAITGYMLYYKTTSSSGDYNLAYNGTGRSDLLKYTVTNLTRSAEFGFAVAAINSIGEGSKSSEFVIITAAVPTAPINLSVNSNSIGSIALSWNASLSDGGESVVGYYVYYKEVSATTFTGTSLIASTTTTLSLTANQEYAIRVTAVNSKGESPPSISVYAYAADVPSSLAVMEVVERYENGFKLGWTEPTSSLSILGYQVFASYDGSYPTELVYDGSSIPTRHYAIINNLLSGQEYSFVFTAINAAGTSSPSPILTAKIGKLPEPPARAPYLVSSGATSITIGWEPSPEGYGLPITNYAIYQDSVNTENVTSDTLSKAITGLTTGTGYTFSIATITELGIGAESYSATYYAADTPSAPTLTVPSSTRESCKVEWTQVTPPTSTTIEGYVVLVNDGREGDEYTVAYQGDNNPSQLETTITGLSSRLSYKIIGYAVNKAGNGSNSTSVTCFTTAPPGQPGRPIRQSSTNVSIVLEWEPAYEDGGSPITEYHLFYEELEGVGTANNENWQLWSNANLLNATVTVTPLKLYRFKVRAKSSAYEAGENSTISQYWASPLPSQVTIDTASTELYGDIITLHWTKLTIDSANELEILGYKIYWNQGFRTYDFVLLEDIANSEVTQTNITGLTPGIEYGFTVSAYSEVGEGSQSTEYYVYAKSKPATPDAPFRVTSSNTSATQASIDLEWNPVRDTGSVPLTGYKLYQKRISNNTESVAYDGSNSATVTTASITGLELDEDYEFWITALNPLESDPSDRITLRAAALPDAPGAITVVTRSSDSLELSWTAVTNNGGSSIVAYTLVEEIYSNATGLITDQVRYYGTSTTVIVDSLVACNTYTFKLKCTNLVGDSEYSAAYQFKMVAPPTIPINLEVTTVNEAQVAISWDVPLISCQDITSYKVYRQTNDDSTSTLSLLATKLSTEFAHTDSTVTSGTTYTYAVTASNTLGGESEYSTSVTATTIAVPSGLTKPVYVANTETSISVSWSDPSADGSATVEYFELMMKPEYDMDFMTVYTGLSKFYTTTGLRSGFTYVFKVVAVNQAGRSSESAVSDPIYTAIAPSVPMNLELVSRSSGQVKIKWTAPSSTGGLPLSGYKIYVAEGSDTYAEDSSFDSTDPTIRTYENTTVTSGEVLKIKISALNQINTEGLASDPIEIIAADLPNKPANPPTIVSFSTTSVTISLTAIPTASNGGSAVTGYMLMIDNGLGDDGSFEVKSNSLKTSITINDLIPGRTYRVKYAGRNIVYDSGNLFEGDALLYSETSQFTTAISPSVPLNLRQSALCYRTSIVIEWDAPATTGGSPISGYTLKYVDNSTDVETTVSLGGSVSSYTINTLTPGQAYRIYIKSHTAFGNSDYTASPLYAYPGVVPTTPTAVTFSSVTRNSITVSWTALSNDDTGGTTANSIALSSYNLYMTSKYGGNYTQIASTTLTTYTVDHLTPGTMYQFRLSATNIRGESDLSSPSEMTPGVTPSSPGKPDITVLFPTQVHITWTEPFDSGGTGITSYTLTITNTSDSSAQTFTVFDGTEFDYSEAEGIAAGVSYTVSVTANNYITEHFSSSGASSTTVSFSTSVLAQAVPTLSASSVTKSSATIGWALLGYSELQGYSTTALVYLLEADDAEGGAFSQIFSTTSATSYDITGVTPGTVLRLRMRVQNVVGYTDYGDILTIEFAEKPAAPDAPAFVDRSGNSTNGQLPFIQISWQAPSDNGGSSVLGYKVELKEGAGSYSVGYDGSSSPDILTWKFEGLNAGSAYTFRVYARNNIEYSTASSETIIYCGTVPHTPEAAPTLTLVTVNTNDADIQVSWSALSTSLDGGSGVLGYYLQINSGYGTDFVEPGQQIVLPATLNYTFTTLTKGATYKFRVAAYNEIYTTNALGSTLNFSPELSVVAALAPAAISSISQKDTYNEGEITIQWTEPSDNGSPITAYILYKDNGLGVFYEIYRGLNLEHTDTGLTSGGSYTYKVNAMNAAGTSTDSSNLVGVAGALPSAPVSVTIVTQSKTSLGISWSQPSTTGGLVVQNYTVNEDSADLVYGADIVTTSTTHTMTVASADEGKTFSFKVAAQNVLGKGEYADDIQLIAANAPTAPTLQLVSRETSSLYLKFIPNADTGGSPIIGYKLYADQGVSGSPYSLIAEVAAEQVLYNVTGLITGLTYSFQLHSKNAAHESLAHSASYTVGVVPDKANEPYLNSSSRGDVGGTTGIIAIQIVALPETSSLPVIKYLLYIDDGAGNFTTVVEHTDLTNLTYEFTGLSDGQEYGIIIQAENDIGKGENSSVVYLVAASVPGAPQSLVFETATETSISFAWSPPADDGGSSITGYKAYMNDFTDDQEVLVYDGNSFPSVLTFTKQNLTAGRDYRYFLLYYSFVLQILNFNHIGSKYLP